MPGYPIPPTPVFHLSPSFTARLAISTSPNPLSDAPDAERILVIRLGALGDVIRTLPAVDALRRLRSEAHVTWLVEPAAAEAVRRYAAVDEVLLFPRTDLEASLRAGRLWKGMRQVSGFVSELRAKRFDLVLDFHAILKTGVIARLSGAATRVSYAPPIGREGAWLFANQLVRLEGAPLSRFERNMGLVESLEPRSAGLAAPGTTGVLDRHASGRGVRDDARAAVPLIRPEPAARERMARALGRADGIVLHPGTSQGAAHKRWPLEHYAALARALSRETERPIFVSAGPGDTEQQLADAIVAASEGAARRAPATPRLAELAALFAETALFIGSDSGPLHLASLTGTPVVQIMGPTHPVENEPWMGTAWRRARVPMSCSPCRRGCAEADCMKRVGPELVAAEVRALLLDSERAGARSASSPSSPARVGSAAPGAALGRAYVSE